MKSQIAILAILSILILVASTWAETSVSVESISAKLICPCEEAPGKPCGMLVSACSCGDTAVPIKNFIRASLDKGDSESKILKALVAQYGEKILAAPKKQGFNLLAWIMPFFAIGVGAILVSYLIRNWTQLRFLNQAPEPKFRQIDLSRYQEKVEEELKKYKAPTTDESIETEIAQYKRQRRR